MLLIASALLVGSARTVADVTALVEPLVIEQVDYEPYIHPGLDGMPMVNLTLVNYSKFVKKTHQSVVLESDYVRVVLLPAMGRVYSIFHKPTGHHLLWKNDIAWPGGANNKLGWWLWIGGIEYTLPGEEHGYTWALEWEWNVVPTQATATVTDTAVSSVSVTASVVEPTTQLRETLTWTLHAGSSALQTDVTIHNPSLTSGTSFAHWVNVPFVPGGQNQLTDNTEFIIPTLRVNVSNRWQSNLGPSPQTWATSPLRHISGWRGMGDITSDGLSQGFYGAFSHDAGEGGVRIFDVDTNPGLDTWTYGYHPAKGVVPMGSGAYNKGYAEMWGGNVKTFPEERAPIAAGGTVQWTEHVFAFQGTGGLGAASAAAAGRAVCTGADALDVWVCPTLPMANASLVVVAGNRGGAGAHVVAQVAFSTDPAHPFKWKASLASLALPSVPSVPRLAAMNCSAMVHNPRTALQVRLYNSGVVVLTIEVV